MRGGAERSEEERRGGHVERWRGGAVERAPDAAARDAKLLLVAADQLVRRERRL